MSFWAVARARRKGIRNGVLYTVEAIEEDTVRLHGGIVLSHDQVKSWRRLSYAQTYASCQGSEFEGTLRLHTDSSRKHCAISSWACREHEKPLS